MPGWSPFAKPLSELTKADLQELKGKSECWWLEYKTEISNEALAKAVAAFANYRGGWIFLGIPANERNEPCLCNDKLGVDPHKYTVEKLRQVIVSRLSPVPDVQIKQICISSRGRIVFVLAVEEGVDPPYIDRATGKIYIRRGEISSPIDHVKNRAELDRLYDRAQSQRDRISTLIAKCGSGQITRSYHARSLDPNYRDKIRLWLSVVLVPVSAGIERFEEQWEDDSELGKWILERATARESVSAYPHKRWQYGNLFGPATTIQLGSVTTVVAVNRWGIIEISCAMPTDRSKTVKAPDLDCVLEPFVTSCIVAYWKRQYDGRIRMIAQLRPAEGKDAIAVEREMALPPARAIGEHDDSFGKCKDILKKTGFLCGVSSVSAELVRELRFRRYLSGVEQ